MSRTKRTNPREHNMDYYRESGDMDWHGNPHHRDKKDGENPPGWFKRMRRRLRRHRAKMAMRNGKEPEKEKNDDQWNWT